MIILNEREYAERCLRDGMLYNVKPFLVLSILAKYYYHCCGYRKKKITSLLIEFMEKYYPNYYENKLNWNNSISKISANAGKYTLFEINSVWITKSELDKISELHNKVLERLAFTFLCLAKLGNLKNEKNNGWVNIGDKEIFSLSHITCKSQERDIKIGQLRQLGFLELPKKNDNMSCRVTFINNESENILEISDFRELGYEYMKYKGENFIRCSECGILVRGNKNGTKRYCPSCAQYTPQTIKTVICTDCGKEFEVPSISRVIRCESCRKEERRRIEREKKRKQRE